jgi:O-antigen ligase
VLRQFYGKNKKIRILVTLLTILILSVIYLSIEDDLKKQNFLVSSSQTETNFVKNTLTWDIRTIVWHCSATVANEIGLNLKGLGFTGTKDKLVVCYGDSIEDVGKRDKFVTERFNTHNQFVDFYLSTGLFGLLLFVGLFIAIFLNVRKDFFASALLLVLGSYCFMENVFHRQLGAYYAGFILIILLTNIWKIKTIKE